MKRELYKARILYSHHVILNLFQDLYNILYDKINYIMKTNSYVYILTNKNNNVLYIGVTSDLIKRIWEHKNNVVEGFTKKYNLHKLIYYEAIENIESAIEREKQLKRWHRKWKINLIKELNPSFKDLYETII